MKTITAIKTQNRRRGSERAGIYLDGSFAFSMERDMVVKRGLWLEQTLSDSEVKELALVEVSGRCYNAATRLLSYRPRSEAELRTRLSQRFDREIIEGVILKLRERQMIDDTAFALYWIEEREYFSPRGKRLLKVELARKGIDSEVIDEVLDGIDDNEYAYRAARKKGQSLIKEDYETFRRKMGSFLLRRGFSYETVSSTSERLWQELR
jgi:regulatory protein